MTNLTVTKYSVLTIILIFCSQPLPAQDANKAIIDSQAVEWVRLQNDTDGFSIEIPSNYEFFSDKDGFVMGKSQDELEFKEVKFLTVYHDKTLMKVESYSLKNPKKGLDLMIDYVKGKETSISRAALRGKQFVSRGEKPYSVTQFFATKTNLYVIFTASREENSPAMQRFLASANFNSALPADNVKTIKFSELKNSPFALTDETKSAGNNQNQNTSPNNVKPPNAPVDSSPLTIMMQYPPGYTVAARNNNVTGIMRLRLTFSASGRISKIGIVSTLPEGLTRQAIFSALRIKFLPAEKNGHPISVTKTVEYKFSMY
jgi:hypothetical protein